MAHEEMQKSQGKKKGHTHLLTLMCASTRFPEAYLLRAATSPNVSRALVQFVTTFGLLKVIQTDRGSVFMSKVFEGTLKELGVQHIMSLLITYSLKLVFGHQVRGPLKLLREIWTQEEQSTNVLDYVVRLQQCLREVVQMAHEEMQKSQEKMKSWYDQANRTEARQFQVGDNVLIFLPVPGSSLAAKYQGPYKVVKRLSELDYVVGTPDRGKEHQVCHVNMMKPYVVRNTSGNATAQKPSQSLCLFRYQ
ncbi:protein NYNRIN-like [Palaemon carinicauda]|uniref:protein NYNRIN-like n=1 Tax=Palaemon carinicauda TaxID=392227 RepID=UPI0035B68D49